MAPTRVWELDAGKPKYQVLRFQMIAEMRSAKTMANPAAEPTLSTNSTGRRVVTLKATAPLEVSTPRRFQQPDHTTALFALRDWV
jgi:hypothetical protein